MAREVQLEVVYPKAGGVRRGQMTNAKGIPKPKMTKATLAGIVYPVREGEAFSFAERVYDLEERTAQFGEGIIDFCKRLALGPVTSPLISQVVRSGTSIGANYCEADNAVSKKEFRQKIGTCQKESKETKHWLRMIARAVPEHRDIARKLWQEAKELHLIFSAIRKKD